MFLLLQKYHFTAAQVDRIIFGEFFIAKSNIDKFLIGIMAFVIVNEPCSKHNLNAKSMQLYSKIAHEKFYKKFLYSFQSKIIIRDNSFLLYSRQDNNAEYNISHLLYNFEI